MALPNATGIDITSTALQSVNYMDFNNPQVLTFWILIGVVIVLVVYRLYQTYQDISGQRVIEQDGGIITITRVKNNAINDNILNVHDRSYAINHPPYRIVTILGVQLTLWFADRPKGVTIGLQDTPYKSSMNADEQNEIIRAIPERELSTVRVERGLMFVILALMAGAFLGYLLRGFMGG